MASCRPPQPASPLGTRRRRPRSAARVVHILLAEDHPINQRVVQLILADAPVKLTVTGDGAEAVSAMQREDFDLVLMDLQMPVMDGLVATRMIRELEVAGGRNRCRICVLTANADPDHRSLAFAAGADEFLAKPIDAETLLSVALATNQSQSRQATAPQGD
ncbi:response regulator [Phenylobacterium kunshanense]|uniref:Response regulatory domain-containing protein n=1 Tax=Phenylobacterium kunshanense TaxID=1445034 RepID=A0A328BIB8_9CAUL|nr:response regulator [Phenylobacterium kunshanense]RAK66369.1 hypothetical protein DJ019_08975 [Phenylobacterium kunshanense]